MKVKVVSWLKNALVTCVRNVCSASLRRTLWGYSRHCRHLRRLAARMQQKEVITVAFMVMDLPCWKCDSVFQLMLQHPRFRPVIWMIPESQIQDEDEHLRNLQSMRTYFSERGYEVAEFFSLEQMREQYAPDVVFLAKPGLGVTPWNARNMENELVCYVPYCYQNTRRLDFLFGQECYTWRNFYTTQGIRRLTAHIMTNGAANVVAVGSPSADHYWQTGTDEEKTVWKDCGEGKKRVIWAPHWSIGSVSWYSVATFLELAEGMLQLAEKYADRIQWAFKPHPLLRDTLYQHPEWGKNKTDAYYERWASMPNSQLEMGDYVHLFKQSDAMVHDSGSFIMEYLLADKPCMYLQRKGGFQDFNEDTRQALACYQKGTCVEEVEAFLLDLLRGAPDPMAETRARYREQYLKPPGGAASSAQLIVNDLLNGR